MRSAFTLFAASVVAASGAAVQAQSVQTAYGLTVDGNRIVGFSPSNVSTLLSDVAITGLGSGETIRNIDFRPRNGELIGLSSSNRMFSINPVTGAAQLRLVGTPTPFTLNGTAGMDFNPVPDRIRITTSAVQNLRLNPDTGGLAADDGAAVAPAPALRFVAGDSNAGAVPNVVSVAYTNSVFTNGTPTGLPTTMFAVHRTSQFVNQLVRQGSVNGAPDSPNNGNLTTIGAIFGIFPDDLFGFDIFSENGGNQAYFSGNPISGGTAFYTVDLATGSNAFMGNIGGANPVRIRDFSVIPAPASAALLGLGALAATRRRR
ncbi:MAG: DUF4394 domain-containing protein [Phycisphaerales bacterium]|nr:DUF4394 domain-containing protein [Phycisphaerales bacterium]